MISPGPEPATLIAASTAVWVFLLLPLIAVWALGLVDIFRRDLSRQATAGWVFVVLLLPLAGTLLYFLLRKPTGREVRLAREASAEGRRDRQTGIGPRPPVD